MEKQFLTKSIGSLTKVFANQELHNEEVMKGSALLNETYSFQIAYKSPVLLKSINARVSSELEEIISIRSVGLVPSKSRVVFVKKGTDKFDHKGKAWR